MSQVLKMKLSGLSQATDAVLSSQTLTISASSTSNDVSLDRSIVDQAEEDTVMKIFGANCTDSDKPEPCCQFRCNFVIPKDVALEQRRTFQEMSKLEQDIVILSQLQVFRRSEALGAHYRERKDRRIRFKEPDKMVRKQVAFMFCSFQICKKMYFFLHDIGEKRYKNLCVHFDNFGIQPRTHKSQGKRSNRGNELTPEDINSVTDFIKSFADRNLLPTPGRTPKNKNSNVIKLPPIETKSSIHRQYCSAMESQSGRKVVARSTFLAIWKKYCPHIVFAKPSADVCDTVKKYPKIGTAA